MTATRRRGAELENAILEAAWDQLVEAGYDAFTIDAVAARAGTSRPVLYRRWDSREELLHAALRHHGEATDAGCPDTGSLRGDLIALLTAFGAHRHEAVAVLVGLVAGESGRAPGELREHLVADRAGRLRLIFDRAIARGEVDPDRVTDRVVTLGADLVRHQLLLTFEPVPAGTVEEIVDEVVLPLVR